MMRSSAARMFLRRFSNNRSAFCSSAYGVQGSLVYGFRFSCSPHTIGRQKCAQESSARVCKNRATIPAKAAKTDIIDRWDLLILRKLLKAGKWPGNPAYRPVPPFLNVPGNFKLGLLQRKARTCSWLALSISACTESSVSILASGPHMFVLATITGLS
jgi:hypothetical protein